MGDKKLYIFVEGNDDENLLNKVLKPIIKYDEIYTIQYSRRKIRDVNNYINSINSIGADYIFITDIDSSPCVTAKKEEVVNKWNKIEPGKIIIVVKEIESWYVAGLDLKKCQKLGIKNFPCTDELTKEQFRSICKTIDSLESLKAEIRKLFDVETAKQKNRSFKYFVEKYCR